MIIIWRGYGILVLVAAFAAVMAGAIIVDTAKLHPPIIGVVYTAMIGLAGIAIWFFTQRIESEPAQLFIEKATGREIAVRRSAGSLFFIPTRYWAFILPGLAVVGDIYLTLNPPVH